MTLGTGIFASTVLVLLAMAIWQITARHKWKLAGKVAAGFVAVCAVIGIWIYVDSLPAPPAPPELPHVVTELGGVKLGMSPTDVKLALGKPDTASEPEMADGGTQITYNYVTNTTDEFLITFTGKDKFSTRASLICSTAMGPRVLGFDVTVSSEDEVIEHLGKPGLVSISSDATSKYISYPAWKVAYRITKKNVDQKCVSESGVVIFQQELVTPEAQRTAEAKSAAEAQRNAEVQRAAGQRAAEAQRAADAKSAADARLAAKIKAAAEEKRMHEEQALVAGIGNLPNVDTLTFNNGGKYIGQIQGGRRNGIGAYFGPDGVIYRGGWRNDMRNGQGVCSYPDGKKVEGTFINGNGPC